MSLRFPKTTVGEFISGCWLNVPGVGTLFPYLSLHLPFVRSLGSNAKRLSHYLALECRRAENSEKRNLQLLEWRPFEAVAASLASDVREAKGFYEHGILSWQFSSPDVPIARMRTLSREVRHQICIVQNFSEASTRVSQIPAKISSGVLHKPSEGTGFISNPCASNLKTSSNTTCRGTVGEERKTSLNAVSKNFLRC